MPDIDQVELLRDRSPSGLASVAETRKQQVLAKPVSLDPTFTAKSCDPLHTNHLKLSRKAFASFYAPLNEVEQLSRPCSSPLSSFSVSFSLRLSCILLFVIFRALVIWCARSLLLCLFLCMTKDETHTLLHTASVLWLL